MGTDTDGLVHDSNPFNLSVNSEPVMEQLSMEDSDMEELDEEVVPYDEHAFYYNMQGEKYLHLYNHFKYEKNQYYGVDAEKLTRHGTHADVRRLKQTFKGFGFKPVVHEDLRYHEILQEMEKLASMDHKATSCVAVAILTHGRNGGVLLAHDKPYYLSTVSDILQNGHPSLVGKPKVFFVQACRSGHQDYGRPVLGKDNVVLPTHADTLFFYSSSPHYYSYRHLTKGTWMMRNLCKVLNLRHQFFDLLQMLTFVQQRVAEKGTNTKLLTQKQMPETKHTLTKLLKLTKQ